MTQVPYTLRVLAGETETRYGERLYHSGAVHIVEKSAKRLSCKVADGEMYDVVFTDDGEAGVTARFTRKPARAGMWWRQ